MGGEGRGGRAGDRQGCQIKDSRSIIYSCKVLQSKAEQSVLLAQRGFEGSCTRIN